MSLRRSIRHEDQIYFLTLTVVHWIDSVLANLTRGSCRRSSRTVTYI